MQNGKRHRKQGAPQKLPESNGPSAATSAGRYDPAMVEHVRMATSLFEGRKVSRREVLEMLAREKKRQHSIGGGEKTGYRARDLNVDSS